MDSGWGGQAKSAEVVNLLRYQVVSITEFAPDFGLYKINNKCLSRYLRNPEDILKEI